MDSSVRTTNYTYLGDGAHAYDSVCTLSVHHTGIHITGTVIQ